MLVARAARLARVALAIASVAGCGFATTSGGAGQSSSAREDRVTIGGYGEVVAMAASHRMVFVASPSGLATYDRVAQRWLRPLTEADGYPAARVTAIAGDPDIEGVWIASLGEVLFYRPEIDQLIRTIVAGEVNRIFFDRDAPGTGAYVGGGEQWTRVSAGGFAHPVAVNDLPPQARRIAAPSFESLAEEIPALGSFSDLLTRDAGLRSWRPSSAARVQGMSEVWLGTLGGGVLLSDPLFNRARHIPFGLFEPGVSALALASDGVWAAALGTEPAGTGGVTFAGTDLQDWRWLRGPGDGSMAGLPGYDMVVREGIVWVATDRGVARRDSRDAEGRPGARDWTWVSPQGSRRTYSLAILGGSVWAGTDAGVVRAGSASASDPDSTMSGRDAATGRAAGSGRVRALLATGDSLWVASSSGLAIMRLVNDDLTLSRQALGAAPAWLQAPAIALARSDSVVIVATDARVGVVGLRTGAVSALPGNPDLSRLGRLTTVAMDTRSIWIGGQRGALVIERASGLMRSANVPGLAGEIVFDIALQPEYAWLATPSGLVRIRRLPDGGVR